MKKLTNEQRLALGHARHLAENGVPLFIARPDPSQKSGFKFPSRWDRIIADVSVVDRWRPGDALCVVMGHLVDGVDIDPRSDGDASFGRLPLPRTYGQASTPSGGRHYLVATMGVGSRDGVLPGIDVKAGDADGGGRGMLFIAPTERVSKVTGKVGTYAWVEAPNLEMLALVGGDTSGAQLAEMVTSAHTPAYDGPSYDGPSYDELPTNLQGWADQEVAKVADTWRVTLVGADEWPEHYKEPVKNRGWRGLALAASWAIAKTAAAPWTGLDEDAAHALFLSVLTPAMAADTVCTDVWGDDQVDKASAEPVEPPPWDGLDVPLDDPSRSAVDVTNQARAARWVKAEIGTGALSGLFRRNSVEVVHTPRIGEQGYVFPKNARDSAGPAQVRRIEALELASRIDNRYDVFKMVQAPGGGLKSAETVFPHAMTGRALAVPDELPNVRDLDGVTHTPVVRADGSILDVPGYDAASAILYLPDPSLTVPPVSDRPTRAERQKAGELLLSMVAEFPFVTAHDRANYLGALITPVLRPLLPPPYKLVALGAPQRGSGKSLLAELLREIHGGVFKSEFPSNDDELRKFVTSTLDATTGPVVQLDNVTGVLKSSVLDGMLTSATWDDRYLGVNKVAHLTNDRLWVVTGNNVTIGGDLERRTLWVTIDANMEHPEERADFAIPQLRQWAHDHRGDLLWAMLTLIRAWVVADRPTGERPTSDNFGDWVAALRGILAHAELGDTVGTVGHEDSVLANADPEDEEWSRFLAAAHRVFGSEEWTASEALARVSLDFGPDSAEPDPDHITEEELPGNVAGALSKSRSGAARSLGLWLKHRNGRWAAGLSVRAGKARRGSVLWHITTASGEDVL